jgi:3-methyladenine DNA glycosylase/8-oxoguanine DNA glycosylase
MRLTLPARAPFLLRTVLHSHGWIQLAPFSAGLQPDELHYVDQLSTGRVVELFVHEAPGGVAVEVDSALSPLEVAEVEARVTWMLGLDQDLSDFHAVARSEPKLAQATEQARGRVLRSPTLFEDVVKTILTTNTAWGGTIRMNEALVQQYGEPLPSDPGRRAFPPPQRLAEADPGDLRSAAKLGYRAPYVHQLAQAVAAGNLDLEALKSADLPTPEVRQALLGIKGIGDYAAANLLMILGRYDYIPVDSWACKMVSQEWYGGQPVGRAEVEEAFAAWGPWKGLAYWCWEWIS